MNNTILIWMSVILLLFVWSWIALVILNRLTLEKKIEKLDNITNPLPEEERSLRNLKDLRDIERAKVSSAKTVVGLFMFLVAAAICASPWWNPLYDLFGVQTLSHFSVIAFSLLTFFCLPIYVGLSLAGTNKRDKKKPGEEGAGKSGQAAA